MAEKDPRLAYSASCKRSRYIAISEFENGHGILMDVWTGEVYRVDATIAGNKGWEAGSISTVLVPRKDGLWTNGAMVIFHDYLPFSYEVYPHPVSVLSEAAFAMKCQNAVNVLKLWDERWRSRRSRLLQRWMSGSRP